MLLVPLPIGLALRSVGVETEPEYRIQERVFLKAHGLELSIRVPTNRLVFGQDLKVDCELCNSNALATAVYLPGLAVSQDTEIQSNGLQLRPDEFGVPLSHARLPRGSRELDYRSLAPGQCLRETFSVSPSYFGTLVLTALYNPTTNRPQHFSTNTCPPIRIAVERSGSAAYLSGVLRMDPEDFDRMAAVGKLALLRDDAAIGALVWAVQSDSNLTVRCLALRGLQGTLGVAVDPLPDMYGPEGKIREWLTARTNTVLSVAEQRLKK